MSFICVLINGDAERGDKAYPTWLNRCLFSHPHALTLTHWNANLNQSGKSHVGMVRVLYRFVAPLQPRSDSFGSVVVGIAFYRTTEAPARPFAPRERNARKDRDDRAKTGYLCWQKNFLHVGLTITISVNLFSRARFDATG